MTAPIPTKPCQVIKPGFYRGMLHQSPRILPISILRPNLLISFCQQAFPRNAKAMAQGSQTPIAVGDDYDGDIRQGEAGYSGTGVGTDIGADEGNFVLNDVIPPLWLFLRLKFLYFGKPYSYCHDHGYQHSAGESFIRSAYLLQKKIQVHGTHSRERCLPEPG